MLRVYKQKLIILSILWTIMDYSSGLQNDVKHLCQWVQCYIVMMELLGYYYLLIM